MSSATRRATLALLAALPLLSSQAAAAVKWERDAKDPRWVQGTVRVPTSPAAVLARLEQVNTWPAIFTDIKELKVKTREPNHWKIRLETRAFDCGAHDYHINFLPERTIKIRIDAPGVDAIAYVRIRDGENGGAFVTYSLYVDVRGVVGWFVSEKQLREKQEFMVVRYLTDLEKAFGGS